MNHVKIGCFFQKKVKIRFFSSKLYLSADRIRKKFTWNISNQCQNINNMMFQILIKKANKNLRKKFDFDKYLIAKE